MPERSKFQATSGRFGGWDSFDGRRAGLDPRIEVAAPIRARSILRKETQSTQRLAEASYEVSPSREISIAFDDASQWGDEDFEMVEMIEQLQQDRGWVPSRGAVRVSKPWTLHQSLKDGRQLFDAEKTGATSLGEALLSMRTKLAEFPRADRSMMSKSPRMLTLRAVESGGLSDKILTYDKTIARTASYMNQGAAE